MYVFNRIAFKKCHRFILRRGFSFSTNRQNPTMPHDSIMSLGQIFCQTFFQIQQPKKCFRGVVIKNFHWNQPLYMLSDD